MRRGFFENLKNIHKRYFGQTIGNKVIKFVMWSRNQNITSLKEIGAGQPLCKRDFPFWNGHFRKLSPSTVIFASRDIWTFSLIH